MSCPEEAHIFSRRKLMTLGLVGVPATVISADAVASQFGYFPLQWLFGAGLKFIRKRIIERQHIDTSKTILFEPTIPIPGLTAALSSAYCGVESELCDTSVLFQPYSEADKYRALFLDEVSRRSKLNPIRPNDLIYMLSDNSPVAVTVLGKDIVPNKKNVFYGESIILRAPGRLLCAQPVDCSEIVVAHPQSKTLAVIHGNKYAESSLVIPETIKAMGINPSELFVWIPPFAHSVSDRGFAGDLPAALTGQAPDDQIDLRQIYKKQLLLAGINIRNIQISPQNTVTNPYLFSNQAAGHFIGPNGERLPIGKAISQALLKGFSTQMLVAGFLK